ncbi:ribonuclease H-like domain-containing protein [Tanacetum coccineum]
MDTGASSHLANNTGIRTSFSNSSIYPSVFVGNGHSIPVTHTGHSFLHTSSMPLHLNHIVTPHIIKNLISVRQFTRDNDVSVEFDAYGFSVKDYQTGRLLLRCDSTGDLYLVTQQPSSQTPVVLLSFGSTTWHRRMGHPEDDVLRRKHAKLPFYNSKSSVNSVFEIIHSDIWTSPIPSESGIKYYAIFLDHFSHFVWVYPLHKKTDLFDNFVAFRAYVNKQFNVDTKALQCDHGGEYDNTRFHELFRQNGIQFWFFCPRTSQQNGKSERMLRTINNLIRTLSSSHASITHSNNIHSESNVHVAELSPNSLQLIDSLLWALNGPRAGLAFFIVLSHELGFQIPSPSFGLDGEPVSDPTLYRSLAGALQYLTFTRPDLSYAVQQHSCIFYAMLNDTLDVDWDGCHVTRLLIPLVFCVFLGDNFCHGLQSGQVTLSRSSA